MNEAPLSANVRVGDWLFTARGADEAQFAHNVSVIEQYAAAFKSGATLPAPTQVAAPAPVPQPANDPVATATAALADAGITATPVPQGIEERTDKWGGRYVKGDPGVPSCQHGPRITAYKTSKAGKPYKAFVCVNDSPFGQYSAGKCPQEYPER